MCGYICNSLATNITIDIDAINSRLTTLPLRLFTLPSFVTDYRNSPLPRPVLINNLYQKQLFVDNADDAHKQPLSRLAVEVREAIDSDPLYGMLFLL